MECGTVKTSFDALVDMLRDAHEQEVQLLRGALWKAQGGSETAGPGALWQGESNPTLGPLPASGPSFPTFASATASSHQSNPVACLPTPIQPMVSVPSTKPKNVMLRFDDALQELRAVPKTAGPLERWMARWHGEGVMATLILINCCLFALQGQLDGLDKGVDSDLTSTGPEPWWDGAIDMIKASVFIVSILFIVENGLKFCALGPRRFVEDSWNLLDFALNVAWLLGVTNALNVALPNALRSLRLLRLLRLVRILRVTRTLKWIQLSDSLFLLNAALRGSLGVLCWSCLYLVVLQLTIAVLITEALQTYYLFESAYPLADRREVFERFGTSTRSLLTMFEMTLANWPPVCRLMADAVGEWWIGFALLHKLTVGVGLVGIIYGVVMQETFKAAAQDPNVMVRDKKRANDKITTILRQLFVTADGSGDGRLNFQEFFKLCEDPILRLWLASIGLNTGEDTRKIFKLLDKEGDGMLTADEFHDGVERLRGLASGIDLHVAVNALRKQLNILHGEHRENQAVLQQLTLLTASVPPSQRHRSIDTAADDQEII